MTELKKLIPLSIITMLFCYSNMAVADTKPAAPASPAVTKPIRSNDSAATKPAKNDNPVADAEKNMDDATKDIDENPGAQISWIIELAKSGRWGPFAGQLLLFLVWILRKYIWKFIKASWLPYVTLGGAMLTSVAVGLIAGNAWWKILIDGLVTSGSAMALWSLLFKHFMKPKEKSA